MIKFGRFKEIEDICNILGIRDFTINDKGLVDVNGDVSLSERPKKLLGCIPIKFGTVRGSFHCNHSELTTLEGCPEVVTGNFYCFSNRLVDLEGCPKEVGRDFDCSHNQLKSLEHCSILSYQSKFNCYHNEITSLKGSPDNIYIFNCHHNLLTTLEGGPSNVNRLYDCAYNELTSLKGSPKEVVEFNCSGNKLNSLIGGPSMTMDYRCDDNPLYTIEGGPIMDTGYIYPNLCPVRSIFKLFNSKRKYTNQDYYYTDLYKLVKKSIEDYDFIRGNKIIKSRLQDALEEISGESTIPPDKIKGYTYI